MPTCELCERYDADRRLNCDGCRLWAMSLCSLCQTRLCGPDRCPRCGDTLKDDYRTCPKCLGPIVSDDSNPNGMAPRDGGPGCGYCGPVAVPIFAG
jgi:hypothetical protein